MFIFQNYFFQKRKVILFLIHWFRISIYDKPLHDLGYKLWNETPCYRMCSLCSMYGEYTFSLYLYNHIFVLAPLVIYETRGLSDTISACIHLGTDHYKLWEGAFWELFCPSPKIVKKMSGTVSVIVLRYCLCVEKKAWPNDAKNKFRPNGPNSCPPHPEYQMVSPYGMIYDLVIHRLVYGTSTILLKLFIWPNSYYEPIFCWPGIAIYCLYYVNIFIHVVIFYLNMDVCLLFDN